MKKLTIAGMFLWNVEIEYAGDPFLKNHRDRRTFTVATRHKTIREAQKKTATHLRQYRYDFPRAKIIGVSYEGWIDI